MKQYWGLHDALIATSVIYLDTRNALISPEGTHMLLNMKARRWGSIPHSPRTTICRILIISPSLLISRIPPLPFPFIMCPFWQVANATGPASNINTLALIWCNRFRCRATPLWVQKISANSTCHGALTVERWNLYELFLSRKFFSNAVPISFRN